MPSDELTAFSERLYHTLIGYTEAFQSAPMSADNAKKMLRRMRGELDGHLRTLAAIEAVEDAIDRGWVEGKKRSES